MKYKGAFNEWALQVNQLQGMSASVPTPEMMPEMMKEAQKRVESAETAYRAARNRLTENIRA